MAEIDLVSLLNECGVNLYDSETVKENGRTIFRVYIIKQDGITLDDCEKVSKTLSPIFDVMPPVSGDWTLEVSSPGLERKLTKPEHFKSSIGEFVKLELANQEKYKCKIIDFSDEEQSISCELIENDEDVNNSSKKVKFPLKDIKKAKTYIQW